MPNVKGRSSGVCSFGGLIKTVLAIDICLCHVYNKDKGNFRFVTYEIKTNDWTLILLFSFISFFFASLSSFCSSFIPVFCHLSDIFLPVRSSAALYTNENLSSPPKR